MSTQAGVAVAIVGASGNIGRKIIELLISRNIVAPTSLKLFASKKSAGKKIRVAHHEWNVEDSESANFNQYQMVLFAVEGNIAKRYVSQAVKAGAVVVDSSSLFRLDPVVPLIVTPVNKHLISIKDNQLFAIANCISSPVSIVLASLQEKHKIKRVVLSTYQSVSGAGKAAMDELNKETNALLNNKKYVREVFNRQIALNLIPQIGEIMEDGFTHEEFKIMHEIQKIVGGDFKVTATAVRVPVMIGHSVSLGIEFEKEIDVKEVGNILKNIAHIKVVDQYQTPVEVVGEDQVYVGRLRKDPSVEHGVQMWLCSDNLRRGAATDMVEVVSEVIKQLGVEEK